MNRILDRLARFVALAGIAGTLTFAGLSTAAAEGSGVGSGPPPPPPKKIVFATFDFVVYDDGL
ncbi:MAG: hypothetical protein NZ557_02800, partial [Chthonomonadaceae bacterium]|nr:hypothetical protein [Chthonomonadaceae bacterium]